MRSRACMGYQACMGVPSMMLSRACPSACRGRYIAEKHVKLVPKRFQSLPYPLRIQRLEYCFGLFDETCTRREIGNRIAGTNRRPISNKNGCRSHHRMCRCWCRAPRSVYRLNGVWQQESGKGPRPKMMKRVEKGCRISNLGFQNQDFKFGSTG